MFENTDPEYTTDTNIFTLKFADTDPDMIFSWPIVRYRYGQICIRLTLLMITTCREKWTKEEVVIKEDEEGDGEDGDGEQMRGGLT